METTGNIVDKFFYRAMSNTHIKYKLWAKDPKWWYIDCSWLISYFWKTHWLFTDRETKFASNAYQIYSMGTKKEYKYIKKWDIVFFLNKSKWINHIAVYVTWSSNDMTIVDASGRYWISKRAITFDTWYIYNIDWEKYELRFATNPLFTKNKYMNTIVVAEIWSKKYHVKYDVNNKPRKFTATVTTYIIPEKDNKNNINCWWSSCKHTANWTELTKELAGKIWACPYQYKLGTKIYIEWLWEITCVDRWWLIVMKWDINTRGNVSSMNRIDVFAWIWKSSISLSKSVRNVSVL